MIADMMSVALVWIVSDISEFNKKVRNSTNNTCFSYMMANGFSNDGVVARVTVSLVLLAVVCKFSEWHKKR